MRIKFVKPDPRHGTVAQMDSHRGQQLVDAGAAVQVKDDGSDTEAAAPAPAPAPTAAPAPAPTSAPALAAKAAAKTTGKAKK